MRRDLLGVAGPGRDCGPPSPSCLTGRCHVRASQVIACIALVTMGWPSSSMDAEQSATSLWPVGSTWAITVYDAHHQVVGSMTVRVTAEQATSCIAGDWKRLDIVKRQFKDSDFLATKPLSYSIEGTEVTLGVTEVCDGYVFLRGALMGSRVAGDYGTLEMGGFTKLGTFVAARVAQ